MLQESSHLSDRDLLLWADGELPSQRTAEMRRHLNACWTCRTRMAEMEHTIADFIQLYGNEFQQDPPPIEGPRALLKARMAERAALTAVGSNIWFSRIRQVLAAAVLAALLLTAGVAIRMSLHGDYARPRISAVPNVSLTPGAINPIGIQDVCSASVSTNDPAVPDPLKREVMREYGLHDVPSNAYEIDYLVTPQLGGAADIRKLR
ncbi:MAG TPA: hypothetical protein VN924_18750 [Bryobacteraceae bacterium]|nr:hypothetical protein [Bryobacteraceae bacterium]